MNSGGVVEIPLRKLGLVALIDAVDYDLVTNGEHGRWYGVSWGSDLTPNFYARAEIPVIGPPRRQQGIFMHTLVFGELWVDHINGDGLDNRRSNLRKATPAQNARNRPKQGSNTSGFKGVFWFPQGSKNWRAMIRHDGRLMHLGLFHTREEAAAAYDAAAIDLFGEFARPNFAESK